MGNPVRPWRNFLTVWERLDLEARAKLVRDTMRTLAQLRAHRKDLDKRIAYWEGNLAHAREARRILEYKGRSRERHERIRKPKAKTRGNYQGRFTRVAEQAAETS